MERLLGTTFNRLFPCKTNHTFCLKSHLTTPTPWFVGAKVFCEAPAMLDTSSEPSRSVYFRLGKTVSVFLAALPHQGGSLSYGLNAARGRDNSHTRERPETSRVLLLSKRFQVGSICEQTHPSPDWTFEMTAVSSKIKSGSTDEEGAPGILCGRSHRALSWCVLLPRKRTLVERIGIEPMTPCLQSRCSPS